MVRRQWRAWVRLERRPSAATEALVKARIRARLNQRHVAQAVGVAAKTVARWEAGYTHPSPARWTKVVAYLALFVPDAAQQLAELAGVPSPVAPPPTVDLRALEDAVFRAADQLDVAPRRVREALRAIILAAHTANASLADVARALEEKA
jgi:DNA-binding XRE family transcriptional regulator